MDLDGATTDFGGTTLGALVVGGALDGWTADLTGTGAFDG